MTIEQQAETIVEKYINLLKTSDLQTCYTGDLEYETKVTAIQCAITEVEECIAIYKQVRYRKALEHYQQILEHLKQM